MLMSKKTNNQKGLIPTLRFPEFLDEMWDIQKLNELAQRVTRKNKSGDISRVLTNSAIDGVVDQRDYFEKDIANQNNLTGYYVVEKGDYVYNPRISSAAPVGPISKNKVGTGVMSPLYTVFRFKNPKNDFYDQYFKSPYWYHYLKQVSNSGARHDRMSISSKDFDAMPLPVATSEEQQKIADCLSSLDELIAGHARKLEALQSYKTGLMQNLFPTEGESIPKLRFPEFQNNAKWKEKNLEDICTLKAGKFVKSSDIKEKNDGSLYPCYGGNGLRGYTENCNHSGSYPLIGRQGALCGNITYATGDFYATEHAVVATPKPRVNSDWLFYKLNLLNLNQYATGQAQPGLSVDILKKVTVLLPSSPEEQKSISNMLSSVDNLITNQYKKITKLKAHKKGLMQQLFPSQELLEL